MHRAKKWKKLIEFFPSPGFSAEKMTIFLASELTQGVANPMEDERIEAKWFSAREVEKMILDNKIKDAKTMLGYFFWKRI